MVEHYKEDSSLLSNQQTKQQQSDSVPIEPHIEGNLDDNSIIDEAEQRTAAALIDEPPAEPTEEAVERFEATQAADEFIAPDPSEQMDDGEEDASHEWHAEDGTDQGDFVDDDGEELSRVIEELCNSKAEEFALLGYDSVTGKDIWEFVSEQYDRTGIPPLHRLINDILSLRVTDYMNWLTLSAYKGMKFTE